MASSSVICLPDIVYRALQKYGPFDYVFSFAEKHSFIPLVLVGPIAVVNLGLVLLT